MRRAQASAWQGLKGSVLSALDYRIAAEILLLFYEDLAARGQADPLPDVPLSWPAGVAGPAAARMSAAGHDAIRHCPASGGEAGRPGG